jgi:hypothetical protein
MHLLNTMYQRKVRIQLDNTKTSSPEKKAFCKICFDAKQPGFDTHYVRDRPGGSVICPYLLSLACSYCHENGHTVKYCDALKNKHSDDLKNKYSGDLKNKHADKKTTTAYIQDLDGWTQRPTQAGKFIVLGLNETVTTSTMVTETKNKYTSLFQEEVAPVPSVYECNFPSLSNEPESVSTPQLSGWAAVVAKKLPQITKSTPMEQRKHILRWDDECE